MTAFFVAQQLQGRKESVKWREGRLQLTPTGISCGTQVKRLAGRIYSDP